MLSFCSQASSLPTQSLSIRFAFSPPPSMFLSLSLSRFPSLSLSIFLSFSLSHFRRFVHSTARSLLRIYFIWFRYLFLTVTKVEPLFFAHKYFKILYRCCFFRSLHTISCTCSGHSLTHLPVHWITGCHVFSVEKNGCVVVSNNFVYIFLSSEIVKLKERLKAARIEHKKKLAIRLNWRLSVLYTRNYMHCVPIECVIWLFFFYSFPLCFLPFNIFGVYVNWFIFSYYCIVFTGRRND